MDKNFAHEFRPSNESVSLIDIPAVESSDRNDVMKLWDEFRKSAIQSFKYLREKYPTKYKIVLGVDLCWIDEDKYYFNSTNIDQGKKNVEVLKSEMPLEVGEDIYGNIVKTSLSFWIVNKWLENLCKLVPETVINSSSGPTIFGITSYSIIKCPLKEIVNKTT